MDTLQFKQLSQQVSHSFIPAVDGMQPEQLDLKQMDVHEVLVFMEQRSRDYACMAPITPVISLPAPEHACAGAEESLPAQHHSG